MEEINKVVPNNIEAFMVGGKQKKDPTKDWEGLSVKATVDQVEYEGLIFAKNKKTGTPIKFNNA